MKKTEPWKIPAGKLFYFSEGSYSDYGVVGTFLALEELTEEKFVQVIAEIRSTKHTFTKRNWETKEVTEETRLPDRYEVRSLFIPALVRKGWLVDIDMMEVHLGDYSELSFFVS